MSKARVRGNKQGSVFYLARRKCWMVQLTVDWRPPTKEGGNMIPVKKTYSGYKTKKEALSALNKILNGEEIIKSNLSLDDVFKKWQNFYAPRVSPKTMSDNYVAAYKHFSELKYRRIDTITAAELQKCMDDCKAGKRMHQLMKTTAGLIWGYAFDANIVHKDITDNLYIGKHATTKRKPLTSADVELIKNVIGTLKYAEYIYCQCYLGYRPGEFLEIKKEQVKSEVINGETVYYIVEGIKTEAGMDRIVVVPKQIVDYILERLSVEGTEYLFPMYCYKKKTTQFKGFQKMSTEYYNKFVFKPITQQLGITGVVPYSARHTYANKLKKAEGDDRDKAALIGHTNLNFTRQQYMSSELEDLKAVTDTIE